MTPTWTPTPPTEPGWYWTRQPLYSDPTKYFEQPDVVLVEMHSDGLNAQTMADESWYAPWKLGCLWWPIPIEAPATPHA